MVIELAVGGLIDTELYKYAIGWLSSTAVAGRAPDIAAIAAMVSAHNSRPAPTAPWRFNRPAICMIWRCP
jgi:hypothetical protein